MIALLSIEFRSHWRFQAHSNTHKHLEKTHRHDKGTHTVLSLLSKSTCKTHTHIIIQFSRSYPRHTHVYIQFFRSYLSPHARHIQFSLLYKSTCKTQTHTVLSLLFKTTCNTHTQNNLNSDSHQKLMCFPRVLYPCITNQKSQGSKTEEECHRGPLDCSAECQTIVMANFPSIGCFNAMGNKWKHTQ